MTIMLIYSTVFASGTRRKLDRKQQWELYFWKWTLEPLRIVHGILFGAVEMDQNEITVVLFSQICLSIKGYFSKLNLVVFNQAKFDSIVLISYCYSNATWNGVLGWLTPTTSTYIQVISLCYRPCVPWVQGLVPPVASSNASWALWRGLWWVRMAPWTFSLVYTCTGTGAHQRIS